MSRWKPDLSHIYQLKYSGAIDADGHILEPPDLWENYIEAKYRDRAMRIATDEDGLEYVEINGQPSKLLRKGFPSTMGLMHHKDPELFEPSVERTYVGNAPFGSMNAAERVQLLDAEGIDAALLYPTLGVLWEAELDDVELTLAYCRAYNRWLVDFCKDSGGRLIPVAHIPFDNPEAAAAELERAVEDGCKGAFTMPFTWSRKAHGNPVHDPIFRKAVELDVPLAIHVGFEPLHARPNRFDHANRMPLLANVTTAEGLRHAFTTFFDYGTFERFPDLRLVLLESGGGWIGQWLDRLDVMYHKTVIGKRAGVSRPPSEWFKSNCWISCDPDEKLIPAMMEILGEDRFVWASDFPHADHTPDYIKEIERMADSLPASARPLLLGDNIRALYKL